MKYLILITLIISLSSKVLAMEEVLLDIVNGIWSAERYNERCSKDPITLPATEQEITKSLIEATGQDFVSELAMVPFSPELTLREHAKAVVDSYLKDGCATELALKKRDSIIVDLSQYDKIFVPQ